MQPAVGVPLESRQDWHRNLEAAIQHHSTTLAKQPAISVVEPNGKVQVQVNYSKYLCRGGVRGVVYIGQLCRSVVKGSPGQLVKVHL